MTISNQTARTGPYNGNGSTTVFAYDFRALDQTHLVVTLKDASNVETVQTLTTNYTVSGVGDASGGNITMGVPPASGQQLTISRAVPQTQIVDLANRGAVAPEVLEGAYDKLTQLSQDKVELLNRVPRFPVSSSLTGIELPLTLTANTALIVNAGATGYTNGPTAAQISGAEASAIAAAASAAAAAASYDNFDDRYLGQKAADPTLDNDGDALLTGALYFNTSNNVMMVYTGSAWVRTTPTTGEQANIDTVSGIAANVTTVAGIAADVTTTAGISADVTTVAADGTDIGTVAGISANVTTVAGIAANVTTTAGIAANVTTVAGISTDVTTVAADGTDIGTVAGMSANVTTVAGVAADVTTVAGISADVTTVAADGTDIGTVAGMSANVTTVAGISTDVTTAATNVADITNFADVYIGPSASDPTVRVDASALQAGDLYFNTTVDELRVYSGSQWVAGTAGTLAVQRYSGDGSTVAFTLATAPTGENNTQVYISGVYQQKNTYSISGVTVTFSAAPPIGTDNIEIVTISTLALGEIDGAIVVAALVGQQVVATGFTGTLGGVAPAAATTSALTSTGTFKLNEGNHPTGTSNVALGYLAGNDYTGSTVNGVSIGASAARYNTANNNVAIGVSALRGASGASTGANNIAIGLQAGVSITTANSSLLIGSVAGDAITTGSGNVLLGHGAGTAIIDGSNNTCVGYGVGSLITSGTNNVFLGINAGDTTTTSTNNVVIGYGAAASSATVSNQITLGNASIGTLRCQQTSITALSDMRDKTDIADLGLGLDYINALRPVEFVWAMRDADDDNPLQGTKEAGFIAQELRSAEDQFDASWLGTVLDTNPDRLEASPGKLLPIVVKALQEASAKIDELNTRINTLEGN